MEPTTWIVTGLIALTGMIFVAYYLVRHYRKPLPVTDEQAAMNEEMEMQARMDRVLVSYLLRQVAVKLEDPDRLRSTYGATFVDADMRQKLSLIVGIAKKSLETPMAAFTVLFKDRQEFLATSGVDPTIVKPLEDSYCKFVVGTGQPFAVEDSRTHELVCENNSTLEDGLRAYLGVPFINRKGHILGALCVMDVKPRKWTVDDVQLLTELCTLAVATDFDQVL